MERIGGVQVGASGQPLGAERHPAAVQLSRGQDDDPVVTRWVIIDQLLQDVAAQRSGA